MLCSNKELDLFFVHHPTNEVGLHLAPCGQEPLGFVPPGFARPRGQGQRVHGNQKRFSSGIGGGLNNSICSYNDYACGHIFCYHSVRSNRCLGAYCELAQNLCPRPHIKSITNSWHVFDLHVSLPACYLMPNHNITSKPYVTSNHNSLGVGKKRIFGQRGSYAAS